MKNECISWPKGGENFHPCEATGWQTSQIACFHVSAYRASSFSPSTIGDRTVCAAAVVIHAGRVQPSGENGVLGPPSDSASERPLESHRARKCYRELLTSEDGFYDGVVCTVHSDGFWKHFEFEVRHLEPGAFTIGMVQYQGFTWLQCFSLVALEMMRAAWH